jgi:dolichol-phosphate mannosyltransferase
LKNLVIIPTYNEIENIQPQIEKILKTAAVSILVVDDGSPDGTGELVDLLGMKNPGRVFCLHREKKNGLGKAYLAGFDWGLSQGFDNLIQMDADGSHDHTRLPVMIDVLKQKDFVIGSRYVKGGGTVNWGLFRKLLSLGGSWYARLLLGYPIRDFTGGFNGWRRETLHKIDLTQVRSEGYSFQIELKYRACKQKMQFQEIPIIFEDRRVGQSKMSRKIIFEALYRVLSLRFSV